MTERRQQLADEVTERGREDVKDVEKRLQEEAKEKRANAESDRRALHAAGIRMAEEREKKGQSKIDMAAFGPQWNTAREADRQNQKLQTPESQAAYDEALSRLVDAIPDFDLDKLEKQLSGLGFYAEDFQYIPKAGAAKPLVSDTPPAEYPNATKNAEGQWEVVQDGKTYIIEEDDAP